MAIIRENWEDYRSYAGFIPIFLKCSAALQLDFHVVS